MRMGERKEDVREEGGWERGRSMGERNEDVREERGWERGTRM